MGQDYEFRVRVNELEKGKYCLEAEMFKNGPIKKLELVIPIGGGPGSYFFLEGKENRLNYHCNGNSDKIDKIISGLEKRAIFYVGQVLDYCSDEIGKFSNILVPNNSKVKVRAPGIRGGGARNPLVNSKRVPMR